MKCKHWQCISQEDLHWCKSQPYLYSMKKVSVEVGSQEESITLYISYLFYMYRYITYI